MNVETYFVAGDWRYWEEKKRKLLWIIHIASRASVREMRVVEKVLRD